jgi:hypothetical protein
MTDKDSNVFKDIPIKNLELGEAGGWPRPIVRRIVEGIDLYDVRGSFPDREDWSTHIVKTGFVLHHDGVNFPDLDKDFNGTTLDESLERLAIIYSYHLNKKSTWNGIGYHFAIDPSGRVFITGNLNTHRAHTKGRNYEEIGVVFLGDFSHVRPTDQAISAWQQTMSWVAARTGNEYTVHPHKFYQTDPATTCPGGWATENSWDDFTVTPIVVEEAAKPVPQELTPQLRQQLRAVIGDMRLELNRMDDLLGLD